MFFYPNHNESVFSTNDYKYVGFDEFHGNKNTSKMFKRARFTRKKNPLYINQFIYNHRKNRVLPIVLSSSHVKSRKGRDLMDEIRDNLIPLKNVIFFSASFPKMIFLVFTKIRLVRFNSSPHNADF